MAQRRREADPGVLLMVLRAMAAGVETFDDIPRALARRKEELRERTVEPVMVAWDGMLHGQRFAYGYHVTEVKGHETFVISAPRKAYFPAGRNWGVFVPIYALHSTRNPLAGDLTDFESVMDWMSGLGGTVAATLPLLASFLNEPFEPSPYAPASRLFWNEFYVDVTRIPEFERSAKAKRLAEHRPRKTKLINYRTVMAYKRLILEELARTFFSELRPLRMDAFNKFIRDHPGIEDFARFRSLTDRLQSAWTSWPARIRDGHVREGDYDRNTRNYHLYAQFVVQEQLRALSAKAGNRAQMLYLDLPLGLHPAGYDVWHYRNFFVRGVDGGAPPDLVFTKGQNWGFPPMHPDKMRLNRYQYVIAYIQNHLQYARLLRIDHVMGLHRLYWIPNGLSGDKGVYVEYPSEELYAILSLESHRYSAGIVGENLGIVPPHVNSAMNRHNIHQMYVMQYEIAGDSRRPALRRVPMTSVASLNTHDMPPFRAFLEGTDIQDRLQLGFLNEKAKRQEEKARFRMIKTFEKLPPRRGEGGAPVALRATFSPARKAVACSRIFQAAVQFLADSKANIVLVNLEDLWGEILPQNVPATASERPNWRRRIRPSVERLRKWAQLAEVLSDVFTERSRSLPV